MSKTVGFNGSFYVTSSIDSAEGYTINNVPIITPTSIGPTIVSSNLTSLGNLLSLQVNGITTLNTLNSQNLNAANIATNNISVTNSTCGSLYCSNITSGSSTISSISSNSGTIGSIYSSNINSLVSSINNLSVTSSTTYSMNLNNMTCGNLYTGNIMTLTSTSSNMYTNNINSNTSTASNMYTNNITSDIYYGKSSTQIIPSANPYEIPCKQGYTCTLYIDCPVLKIFAVYIIYFRSSFIQMIAGSSNFSSVFSVTLNSTPNNYKIIISTLGLNQSQTILYNLIVNNNSL
jgi:hypothetical protein